jgi:hypothetical protein
MDSTLPSPIQARKVFVSHSHADKAIAELLGNLLDDTFSGLLTPFFSSDPSPTGGIRPGEDWYQRIHGELSAAEAVWVVATKASIASPWVYWEAGLGRALCPRGIVVLRIGLAANEVHSPLSAYQSYDGMVIKNDGLVDLLGKLGADLGMRLPAKWIESCVEEFVGKVAALPPSKPVLSEPVVSPEQLGRVDAVVARLEAIALTLNGGPGRLAERNLPPFASARFRLLGAEQNRYSLDELLAAIERAAPTTRFDVMLIDADGDVSIAVTDDELVPRATAFISVSPDGVALKKAERQTIGRAKTLVQAIRRVCAAVNA